ncbi:hypothetical protein DB30_04715 [Enhygromyxa salina]|uniref:Uncharacterized protein n=1 Tax=Enhygromyxa salina TaxID=215803 RepID=A0A0C2D3E1_9BACT|nr:hypothetical protein [Enhygromyxa salina]KIG16255.1 hypothetical protein DB30_04715 [Enhygromyxa salina]
MGNTTQPGARERAGVRRVGRRIGWVALAVVLVLGPLIARAWIDGRAQLLLAEAAASNGDVEAQLLHLGRAARWRLPLATHDDQARAQLGELALAATAANEHELALAAWRELRGALVGTRAIRVVDPEQLETANAAIVQLMVRQANASGQVVEAADRARWAAELEQDLVPRWRSLLASACFAAWLFACVGLFALGIDSNGRLDPRPALRWGGAALVSLLAWILLM